MTTKLGTLTLDLIARVTNFTAPLDQAERKAKSSTNSIVADFGRTEIAAKNLVGSLAGLITVGAAVAKTDDYIGLQNRLKLVTDNQKELSQAMSDTFTIAQNSGAAWQSTAMVYQRFADNADRLGLSMGKTAELTDTVSKAIAVSGGSAASAEAALMQFGQALASGVLRGEEFNSIAEQAPALLKAIAQGLNVNIGELRTMAKDGKLTGDVVVNALTNAKASVDELFSKTDFTIGMSLTQLSNSVTKFVGEASVGSGAAGVLSDSIRLLSDDFETFVNLGMVGAAFWSGSYIPAIASSVAAGYLKVKQLSEQIVVQYGAINAERAAAAQAVITLETTLANTRGTLAQLAVEKALEVERMKAQINQTGRIASATRMAQLRQIESQVTMELTAAESALATARSRSAAAGTLAMNAGRGALAVLGGPVGLGLTVAGVAAGYLLMRDNTAEATAKLAEQAKVADMTAESLKKLTGNDRKKAIEDATAAFEAQNKELRNSELAVGSLLIGIQNASGYYGDVVEISNQARLGSISYTEAIERLNKIENIPTELYAKLKKEAAQYDDNAAQALKTKNVLKEFGIEAELVGNKSQNSVVQHNSQADALNNVAYAASNAKKELSDFFSKMHSQALTDISVTGYLQQGYTPKQAQALSELDSKFDSNSFATQAQKDEVLRNLALSDQRALAEQKYADRLKASAKSAADSKKEEERLAKQRREDAKQLDKQQTDERNNIEYQYANRMSQYETDLQKELRRVREANFKGGEAKYIELVKDRFDYEEEMYLRQETLQINRHRWTMEQTLKYENETEKLRVNKSGEYSDEIKELRIQALDEVYNHESNLIRLNQLMTKTAYQQEADEALRTIQQARAIYGTPLSQRASLSLQFAEGNENAANDNTLLNTQSELEKQLAEREIIQSEYDERLEKAVRLHEESKQKIRAEYAEKYADLQDAQYNTQMNMYSSLLSQASSVWGTMTQMIKNAAGESSAAYKAMFLAQQAIAIGQAIINTELAATRAMAEGGFIMGIPMATAVRAMGYASVGLIAGQTVAGLAGIAHGGKTSIPEESTWLLDKGERVLSPRQNADLTGYLSERKNNSQSGGNITVNVTVNSDGSSSTDTQGDSKQLGEMIANAVRQVILKEKRQGGLLA